MPKSRKWDGNRGQSLVETAVVMPLLGVFIFGMVWLMCFCRNSVYLQKMALDRVRQVSADPKTILRPSRDLWGHSLPALPQRTTSLANPWRPFTASIIPAPLIPSVQRERGSFIHVTCKSLLMGGQGYTKGWKPLWQNASAETLIEAPIPAES